MKQFGVLLHALFVVHDLLLKIRNFNFIINKEYKMNYLFCWLVVLIEMKYIYRENNNIYDDEEFN